MSMQRDEKRDRKIIRLLRTTKLTYDEIGKQFDLSRQRIQQIAKDWGVRYEGRERRLVTLANRKIERLKIAIERKKKRVKARDNLGKEFKRLVEVKGLSMNEAGRQLGYSPSGAMYWCAKYGIKSRFESLNPLYRNR